MQCFLRGWEGNGRKRGGDEDSIEELFCLRCRVRRWVPLFALLLQISRLMEAAAIRFPIRLSSVFLQMPSPSLGMHVEKL